MKKSLLKKGLMSLLIVLIVGLLAVGCVPNKDNDGDKNDGDNVEATVDKAALNAELAFAITEQGDYTELSYSKYAEKLAEAKAVAENENATQKEVNDATDALTEARYALVLRSVAELADANKDLRIYSGAAKEIALADYVNTNSLSNITYTVQASNESVTLGEIVDGKFTIKAAEVSETTDVKVTISVSYKGAEKLSVELSITVTNDVAPVLNKEEVVVEYDLLSLTNKETLTIDFAGNVNNAGNLALTYSAKCGEEALTLDGTHYTLTLGSYTEKVTYITYNVTVSCMVNGVEKTLQYTYKLGLKDTSTYGIPNGNFEKGLEGWELNNTVGEAPFAGIDDKNTFWAEGYPMFNVGKYFSSYADGASEGSQGTLASPFFTVNSEYATFMLGGAGNPNVYITIEDKDGNVLALYRNVKFADLPAGEYTTDDYRAMIGETVFLANFVTYKVSLADLAGKEVRFVVHDHASSGWGVVYFDELNTYYASADELPENAVLANNLLADKAALYAELALEITAQGDFTLESFEAYAEKLAAAKALINDIAVTQDTVNAATAALTEARHALTVRPITEVEGANKAFRITSGDSKEILISDFVNVNKLSKITYNVSAANALVTLGTIADGKFTITAAEVSEKTVVAVSIVVSYDGVEKLTVELTVEITNDKAPTVFNAEVVESYDIFELENKTDITIDLSSNVDNAGNLALNYSVEYAGVKTTVDGTLYTFTFGSYTDAVTDETITVTVSYVANGEEQSITYTYKLAMKDTTDYRLVNGDFENGLDGWTQVGEIGNVSSNGSYWNGDFGKDGDKFFSAYEPSDKFEKNFGTLTSSTFVVGGSGFVTFKIGAMRDDYSTYVDVIDANTKEILARYYNGLWERDVTHCTLVAYKANLSEFKGKEVYFRISDYASSDYGLFFADSFITYYENEPDGFNAATPVNYAVSGTIYDVINGGFETGNTDGWKNDGEPGKVTGADIFFSGESYGKDGNFLYSGVEDATMNDAGEIIKSGNGREGNRGTLTSSVFQLGGSGYITYMLGGGNDTCYVQVIDAVTGEILGRYRQQARQEAVLMSYVADLTAYVGRTVRIQVVDGADHDWGCISFDNVVTYYESKPEGYIDAIDVKYEMVNGSFENGMNGWTQHITTAGDHNTLGWVVDTERGEGWYTTNENRKDGNRLFTFYHPDGINCESTMGMLNSATFTLKRDSYVSFRFGAGGSRDVRIELCNAKGEVIATFYNEAEGKKDTEMYAYYYQYTGDTTDCFFRVVDYSTSGYGCFVVDDFRVNLESAPEGFIAAIQ